MKYIIFSLIFFFTIGQASAGRVLFVGNSFTGYTATTLKRFAAVSPLGPHQFEFQFVGGISLQAHASRAETLKAIQCNRFDYIVLQDHSQRTLVALESFEYGVTQLTALARESGAKPLLFETWARGHAGNLDNYLSHQNIVSKAYHDIGSKLNVPVIHIGDAWREIRNTDLALFRSLFLPDLIHPTLAGEYIAAASIYRVLYATDLAWLASLPGEHSKLEDIRSMVNRLNFTGSEYRNPISKDICDTSRDQKQRNLCGCAVFENPVFE